jgi:hypothetical protein
MQTSTWLCDWDRRIPPGYLTYIDKKNTALRLLYGGLLYGGLLYGGLLVNFSEL